MWKWNHSFIILYCFFVFFPWGCFVVFWEIFQAKPVFHLIRVQFVENCLQHRLWKKRNIYNHNKKNFKLICFLQTTFSSSKKLSGFVMWTVIWFMNKNLKLQFCLYRDSVANKNLRCTYVLPTSLKVESDFPST